MRGKIFKKAEFLEKLRFQKSLNFEKSFEKIKLTEKHKLRKNKTHQNFGKINFQKGKRKTAETSKVSNPPWQHVNDHSLCAV